MKRRRGLSPRRGGLSPSFFATWPEASAVKRAVAPVLPNDAPSLLMLAAFVGTTMAAPTFVTRPLIIREKGLGAGDLGRERMDAAVSATLMFVVSGAGRPRRRLESRFGHDPCADFERFRASPDRGRHPLACEPARCDGRAQGWLAAERAACGGVRLLACGGVCRREDAGRAGLSPYGLVTIPRSKKCR